QQRAPFHPHCSLRPGSRKVARKVFEQVLEQVGEVCPSSRDEKRVTMRTAPCFRTAIFLSAFCCAALPSLRGQTWHATSADPAAAQTVAPESALRQNAAAQNSGTLLASDTGTVVVPPIA